MTLDLVIRVFKEAVWLGIKNDPVERHWVNFNGTDKLEPIYYRRMFFDSGNIKYFDFKKPQNFSAQKRYNGSWDLQRLLEVCSGQRTTPICVSTSIVS